MDATEAPGHLARRFQQIAVAVFHAEAEAKGCDLTPVQYAALTKIAAEPGLDQATQHGLPFRLAEVERQALLVSRIEHPGVVVLAPRIARQVRQVAIGVSRSPLLLRVMHHHFCRTILGIFLTVRFG